MRTCPCALSCEDNKYLSSLSASVWPSNKYWQLLASDLQYPYSMVWQGDSSGHSSGDAREAVRKEIQDDFTSVKFNFDSLNVQTITQSPKYSVSKFEALSMCDQISVGRDGLCPGRSSGFVSRLHSAHAVRTV